MPRRLASLLAGVTAVALVAAGCGGSSGSSPSSATSFAPTPGPVLRCLNVHNLHATISRRDEQYNIAAVHEIRIPLGQPGDIGDGLVEFLSNPGLAKKVEGTSIHHFHEIAGSKGTVEYQYGKSTPSGTQNIIKTCAVFPA